MLGFLVYDNGTLSDASVKAACDSLHTFSYVDVQAVGSKRVAVFQNEAPNNYSFFDNHQFFVITGTVIYQNRLGRDAIGDIQNAIARGSAPRALFEELRGSFALVYGSRKTNTIAVLMSREGLRNCFVTGHDDATLFSTNLLLLAGVADKSYSPDGIREFLHLGACLDRKTIFEGVNRADAGTLYQCDDGNWRSERLWPRLEIRKPERISFADAVAEAKALFLRQLEFAASVPADRVGADLTAGTDSRLNLACLMEHQSAPVVTTNGPKDLVDVTTAIAIAKRLNLEHYWYSQTQATLTETNLNHALEVCDGLTVPFSMVHEAPYYEEKSKRFDLITGGGGGPLFKDHYWLYELNRVGKQREPNWERIARFSMSPYAMRDDLVIGFPNGMIHNLAQLFRQRSSEVSGTNNQKLDFVYFDLKCPSFEGSSFSKTTNFLDVYHPMLDAVTVDFSVNLPHQVRWRNNLQFALTHALRPELDWILTDNGLPSIPPVGLNGWLRVFRAKRYVSTALRKLRVAALCSSGERTSTKNANAIVQLRERDFMGLLEYETISFSPIISAEVLTTFKNQPDSAVNTHYLLSIAAAQLYLQRAAEIWQSSRSSAM